MKQRDEFTTVEKESSTGHEEKREFADYVDSFFQHGVKIDDAVTASTHSEQQFVDSLANASIEITVEPLLETSVHTVATSSQDSAEKLQYRKPVKNQPTNTTSTSTGDTDMQDNVINAFNDQAKAMYAPMTKFNSLLVESMEKMTEFQLNTIKSYAEIGLNQMKNAVSIQDAEGLRQFTASQAEATSTINKKILEDAKAMSDMAADFRNKIEDVMAQSRQAAEKPMAAAAKKAS